MLLALLAAVFLAVGIVVRQRATIDVPAEYGVSAHLNRSRVASIAARSPSVGRT